MSRPVNHILRDLLAVVRDARLGPKAEVIVGEAAHYLAKYRKRDVVDLGEEELPDIPQEPLVGEFDTSDTPIGESDFLTETGHPDQVTEFRQETDTGAPEIQDVPDHFASAISEAVTFDDRPIGRGSRRRKDRDS